MKPSSATIRGHVARSLFASALILALAGWWFIATGNMPSGRQTPASGQPDKTPSLFAGAPSWQQDFSAMPDGAVDSTIWNTATPEQPVYNDEEQVYTNRPQNIRIQNGTLILEARKEPFANKAYTSGRVDTKGRQQFLYGKIEATMKFPEGRGTWPAFWMLSASGKYTAALNPSESDWQQPRFYMHDGELDIVEFIGAESSRIESSAHTFARSSTKGTTLPGNPRGFHTFGLEWTPDLVRFTVDGKIYHELQKPSGGNPDEWPFDQPMYIILNLAMGGRMGGEIDSASHSSWQLQVRRVVFYPYTGK